MSKSNTPGADHPAHSLLVGTDEQKSLLAKALPVKLPNDVFEAASDSNAKIMKELRNDYRYVYVNNWIHQCRGYVKLASEPFDVDLFEIELLNLVNPVPIDEMVLFSNKLKVALISKIQGKKITSLSMFEPIFRMYFGSKTPLGGPDEDQEPDDVQDENYPKFDYLSILNKYEVLYLLIRETSTYNDFRDFIDKNRFSSDALRINPYHQLSSKASVKEDILLVNDNTTLYKRTLTYPKLSVPKKRKLSPEDPELYFKIEQFDIASIKFELISKNVYQLNDYLLQLKKSGSRSKIMKGLYNKLTSNKVMSEQLFNDEVRKRRTLSNRRKDFEMARLLATRKRSSRLEAKERQRNEEEQERKLQELEDLKIAALRRSERNRLQATQKVQSDYTSGLSREDRLNLRHEKLMQRDSVEPQSESEQPELKEQLEQPKSESEVPEYSHVEPLQSEVPEQPVKIEHPETKEDLVATKEDFVAASGVGEQPKPIEDLVSEQAVPVQSVTVRQLEEPTAAPLAPTIVPEVVASEPSSTQLVEEDHK